MTRVCALANRVHGRHQEMYLALERSLERKGVPFFFFMEGGPWSWERKVQWEYEQASAHPDDNFVFIDAFDYLFVGEKEELDGIVQSVPLGFSCDAGRKPWPEAELAPSYDHRRKKITPWCWLNGSGPFGKGAKIAEAAEFGLKRFQWLPAETDQTFWTRVFLYGYGELDQTCMMTQALYDSAQPAPHVTPHVSLHNGRPVNTLTLSRPQFLHASGHSWSIIPEELL